MTYTRTDLAGFIVSRMTEEKERLRRDFATSSINHCVLDNILPEDIARGIYYAFPAQDSLFLKKSLREYKLVTAQMNRCKPLVEEAIFAFQDARVVSLVQEITQIRNPEADPQLYAGGISVMADGHFLNPHIDNSHDRARQRYRTLNLLYYISPGWNPAHGGNLELWPQGVKASPLTIDSIFNRLVIMKTNRTSWHSVSPIHASSLRCCVSNYYFSPRPPDGDDEYFHVTSFRGRPEQPMRDLMLRADIALRSFLRKLRPMGIVKNRHYYQR